MIESLRGGGRPLIENVYAREVLDSRGNPTLAVSVATSFGAVEEAMVPSGASTGAYEAVELRDGDKARYGGKGVLKAAAAVNDVLGPAIEGLDATSQREIDEKLVDMDGTPNKATYGANAILGISLAAARAAASSVNLPLFRYLGGPSASTLPVPMMNVINGGKHAEGALQFQECMIVPVGAPTFAEAVRYGAETFHALGKLLHDRGLPTLVGDEGGYAPPFDTLDVALNTLIEAIVMAGYEPGKDIALALDAAATEFERHHAYYPGAQDVALTSADMVDFYEEIVTKYPVISIEDGLGEDDWDGWKLLTDRIGSKVQLVGDDLFVTNTERLARGIATGTANAILVKVNQIGTLTETLDAVEMAHKAGYRCVISHRSGETGDTTIADLAVSTGAGQIKTARSRGATGWRSTTRLMSIELQLGEAAKYPGAGAFRAQRV